MSIDLKNFLIKCLAITFCIAFLFYYFYPRYHFFDENNRANKINGKVEYYSNLSYKTGWYVK